VISNKICCSVIIWIMELVPQAPPLGGDRKRVITSYIGWVLVVLSTIFPMNLRTWIRKNLQGTSSLKGELEIASFPNLVVPITSKPFSIGGKKNEDDQEEEKSAWVFYILSGFGGSPYIRS